MAMAVFLTLLIAPLKQVAAQELGLGRLFTTPSERAILDKSRHRPVNAALFAVRSAPAEQVATEKPAAPSAPAPPTQGPIRFNGYISRGNAPVAVWSQGAESESKLVADVDKSGHAVFRVGSQSLGAEIKPGQVFYPNEKLTTEAYLARAGEPVAPPAKLPANEIRPGQDD